MRGARWMGCAVLLWVAPLAAAQGLQPDDFARGLRLALTGEGPVHAVALPPEVYRVVTRDDLGDLRVFNGGGEELPHAIARSGAAPAGRPPERALPLFPLRGRSAEEATGLTIEVTRAPSGAITHVTTPRASGADARPLQAYLVDAIGLDLPIAGLRLAWADTTSDFVARVVPEWSDDLARWHPWGPPVTLAHLRYAGNRLQRSELPLPPRRVRYVRLSWPEGGPLPALDSLTALPALPEEPVRQWARLEASSPEAHRFLFDQEGVLPVDRVRFELPQPNTLARVELESAPSPTGPWQRRYQGLAYRLRVEGTDVVAPPISTPRTTDRYWRLRADPAGGGLGAEAPALELGWVPERLLFVARGEGPYTLAFGSARALPSAFASEDLVQRVPGREGSGSVATSEGDSFELGGPQRLTREREVPWTQVLLWGVLLLGVGVLLAMTIRLLRQVDRDQRPEEAAPDGTARDL
jgi:hypothetical protein